MTEKWWYNDASAVQATAWLSAGYRVIEHETIAIQKKVHFQKFSNQSIYHWLYIPTIARMLKFCKKNIAIIILAIIPLLLWQPLWENHKENEDISVKLSRIEMLYSSGEYSNAKEAIYEVVPLIKGKPAIFRSGKYLELAQLYDYLYRIVFYDYTLSEEKLSDEAFGALDSIGTEGLSYSSKCKNLYYTILFNRYLAEVNLYQYMKTMDLRYERRAEEYAAETGDAYFVAKGEYIKIENKDDAKIALEIFKGKILNFNCFYYLIINGEYDNADLEFAYNKDSDGTNIFTNALVSMGKTIGVAAIIEDLTYDTDWVSQRDLLVVKLQAAIAYIQLSSAFNSIDTKLVLPIYTVNGSQKDMNEAYIYAFALDYLEDICEVAKEIQCYDILGMAYFELARINYYDYLNLGNQNSLQEFDKNLRLYLSITGKENGISQREYELYFEIRSSGKYLDLYITEMEDMLTELSFLDNPSFYAFSKWELGRHYYYKALELQENNSKNDEINKQLLLASDCFDDALLFFNEGTNSRIFNAICALKSEIVEMQLGLS